MREFAPIDRDKVCMRDRVRRADSSVKLRDLRVNERPIRLHYDIVETKPRAARSVHRTEPDHEVLAEINFWWVTLQADCFPERGIGRAVIGDARPIWLACLVLVRHESP